MDPPEGLKRGVSGGSSRPLAWSGHGEGWDDGAWLRVKLMPAAAQSWASQACGGFICGCTGGPSTMAILFDATFLRQWAA